MTDEWRIGENLEGTWLGFTDVLYRYSPEGNNEIYENTVRIKGVPAETRTEPRPNTSLAQQ
jgi:hypothetical protein